jgi:hypothetical protein
MTAPELSRIVPDTLPVVCAISGVALTSSPKSTHTCSRRRTISAPPRENSIYKTDELAVNPKPFVLKAFGASPR